SQEQYTYFLNTSDLAQGVNFVNVLAEKEGYESQVILLTIIITERNTTIEIFLNGTDFSHVSPIIYTLTIGELLNITIKYKDWLTSAHIDLASVDLEGEGLNKPLPENSILGHYSIILDSKELNRGVNFLTITAYKPNYQPRQKQIKIEIIDKASIMSLYINGENRTSDTFFNFFWGDPLNITVFYQENESRQLINNATIELVEGSILLYNLTRNANYEQYNRTINTADLGVGIRSLLIIAAKENYKTITKNIIITVSERDTYLSILINNINASTVSSFNFSLGESINITAWYRDYDTGDFIFSANLELVGLAASYSLIKHSLLDQYNLTILANDLSLGANFLVITAQKDNYTNLSEPIIISISEKIADLQLFINGTQIYYNGNKTVDVMEILNITATYKDYRLPTHIPNANIEILGIGIFDESPYNYYNLTLKIEDLQQEGLATLIFIAEKTNYKTQTFQFFLKIVQKQTNLEIFFDNVNVTIDPTITLPIGSILNLTVKYTDIAGAHITNANVTLSLDFTADLAQQIPYQQYYIIIDTSLLKIGVNIISLEAKKPNHDIQAENLRIQIRKIRTDIDTEDGDDTYTIILEPASTSEDVKFTIEIKNLDFGGGIEDAEVTYEWKHGDGDLDEEGDGLYELTLKGVQEGTYTITITAYKEGGRYDFEEFEITLVVKRSEEESFLYQILLVVAIIAGVALLGYIVAYQKYLKYPKPVRKVRKYRRTLKRKRAPKVDIISREKAFNDLYSEELGMTSKLVKSKPKEEVTTPSKLIKKKPLKSSDDKKVEETPKKIPQKSQDNQK
ncbi:MAG: hypothetical protein HWN67_15355, partial [Candidatus Helarchaeota archaeon]|nr:hypothetical protein [Candidatus Helarchaeota archaeon]